MMQRLATIAILLAAGVMIAAFNQPHPDSALDSRWQKYDADGVELAPWSGPWACVCDQQTGLLWEVKDDGEGIHDGNWTYSWSDGEIGVENNGDCFFEADRCDTQDLIERANTERRCSVGAWRLPTSAELQSLITHEVPPGSPTIAEAFFPHTKKGDYWTADGGKKMEGIFKHLGEGANAISFIEGELKPLPYRNAAFVRLVTKNSSFCKEL